MSEQIAVRLPERDLAALDQMVDDGSFPSRAAAVRAAVELLLRAERDRRIADQYRRAYRDQPQEAWIGETGLRLGAETVAGERRR